MLFRSLTPTMKRFRLLDIYLFKLARQALMSFESPPASGKTYQECPTELPADHQASLEYQLFRGKQLSWKLLSDQLLQQAIDHSLTRILSGPSRLGESFNQSFIRADTQMERDGIANVSADETEQPRTEEGSRAESAKSEKPSEADDTVEEIGRAHV